MAAFLPGMDKALGSVKRQREKEEGRGKKKRRDVFVV